MDYKALAKVARMALATALMVSALTLALGPVQPAYAGGGAISYGQSVAGWITDSNLNEYHRFEGNGGDLIRISLDRTGGDLDPYLALYSWNGAEWVELIADDDSGGNRNSLIGIGLGEVIGWVAIGPQILIAIGVGVLLRGILRR